MEYDPAQLSLLVIAFLMVAAFMAGFIDSIAGGGGLISVPALLVAGISPHFALGTNKFMTTLGTCASLAEYARSGFVVWRVVAAGVAFSLAGSALGAKAVLFLNPAILGKVIIWLLPVAVIFTFMPGRAKAKGSSGEAPLSGGPRFFLITAVTCTAVGFYDGFFGPGTGSLLLLSLHFFLKLDLVSASATAKAINLASNAGALAVFIINGTIVYSAALPMALANAGGNWLGSRLAVKRGPAVVRRMLFISLALLFATLVWRYYFAK